MFNSITGELTGHQFPYLYISTHGVEWQVEVSAHTFRDMLARDAGDEVQVLVHLYVREDILKLYGFSSSAERAAYLQLITVSGIGPKQALKILSGISADQLVALLEAEDVGALTRLPGIGTKSAQKMILQLKGHLVTETTASSGAASGATGTGSDLLQGLVEMGFDRSRAEKALRTLTAVLVDEGITDPGEQERQLFARAIRELS